MRETLHGGEFIIVELGPLSRDSGTVAAGLQLDAGTALAFNGDSNLIAYTGSGSAAGVLIYPVDTRDGVKAASYIARRAKVRLEELTYPDGLAAETVAALTALTIEVRPPGPLPLSGGGGGSGTPEWVPDNAKIHIDLVNDRAWTEADGIVAIDTLLGSDPNTVNGWGSSSYDAGNLTADGYIGSAPAFIGAVRSALLSGATATFRTKQVGGFGNWFVMMSADGADAITCNEANSRDIIVDSYNGSLHNVVSGEINIGSGVINVMAVTITSSRADVVANGLTAIAGVVDDTDRPGANPFVAAIFDGSDALQSVTVYDPLPDTIGLAELSQTGVANTAPHDISATWADGRPAPTFTTSEMVTDFNVSSLSATDDQGNLITWTVQSDESGKLAVLSGEPCILYCTDNFTAGDFDIVVRATDPGGLYVEQEFTVTVTA